MQLPTTGKEFAKFLKCHRLTQRQFAAYCGKEDIRGLYWARCVQQCEHLTLHNYAMIAFGYYRFRMEQLDQLMINDEHALKLKASLFDSMMDGFERIM